MPQYPQPASWRLEGGAQVLDPETAVKDGILGGGGGETGGAAVEKVDLRRMMEELDAAAAAEEVPGVFICPISLEPMVDPVTLCTGQTYERANIGRWLALGRRTCPTTMQELWDDALVPNRTLTHLIHAWYSQRYLRFRKRSDDVHGRAADLLDSLRRLKGQPRLHALRDLRRLAAAHPAAKKTLQDSPVAAPLLCSLLGPLTSHALGSEAVAILADLSLPSDARTSLTQPAKISLLVDMLNEGTLDTKINCTKLIHTLLQDNADDPRSSDIVSSLSLLAGLLRLVKDRRYPNGTAAGLSLLKTISSHAQVPTLIVSIGAVPQLVELLPSLTPEFSESALQILDNLSTVPEGRSALKECPQTIPNMVRMLMRVSEACTQSALSILSSVCELSPEECAAQAVEAGLAAKLLLVIQSGCTPVLKQRAAELLKLCSLNYTATHFISKCKLTRTIQ